MTSPLIPKREVEDIISDLLASNEYRHSKVLKNDIEVGDPCECIGSKSIYQCQSMMIVKFFKFLNGGPSFKSLSLLLGE